MIDKISINVHVWDYQQNQLHFIVQVQKNLNFFTLEMIFKFALIQLKRNMRKKTEMGNM